MVARTMNNRERILLIVSLTVAVREDQLDCRSPVAIRYVAVKAYSDKRLYSCNVSTQASGRKVKQRRIKNESLRLRVAGPQYGKCPLQDLPKVFNE